MGQMLGFELSPVFSTSQLLRVRAQSVGSLVAAKQ